MANFNVLYHPKVYFNIRFEVTHLLSRAGYVAHDLNWRP